MLRSLKNMEEYKVNATDGDIGSVSDFYFDELHWTIRYLVVETGGFWDGPARVLVSPIAFREAEWATKKFHLSLTRDKVKNSPALPHDIPLSRQYEQNYFQYYNWPYYWGYGGIWGDWGTPGNLVSVPWTKPLEQSVVDNPHLLRTLDVIGSVVVGKDKEIGHIQDFIVDDSTWTIRYVVVNTRHWWSGKSVIVSPHWISKIDGEGEKVYVDLSAQVVDNCPEWSPDQPVNREYESRLFDYYGRPAYWNEDKSKAMP
jgi:hypothetical protein